MNCQKSNSIKNNFLEEEIKKIYSILSWYNIATNESEDEKLVVAKILYKLRRLTKDK